MFVFIYYLNILPDTSANTFTNTCTNSFTNTHLAGIAAPPRWRAPIDCCMIFEAFVKVFVMMFVKVFCKGFRKGVREGIRKGGRRPVVYLLSVPRLACRRCRAPHAPPTACGRKRQICAIGGRAVATLHEHVRSEGPSHMYMSSYIKLYHIILYFFIP